jgi:hypothetical protein
MRARRTAIMHRRIVTQLAVANIRVFEANAVGPGKTMDPFDREQRVLNRSPLDDETILSREFWGELRVFLAVAKAKSFNDRHDRELKGPLCGTEDGPAPGT